MTELKDIINYVVDSVNESILFKLGSAKVDTNMILDCAVRIYNSNSFKGKEQGKEVVTKEIKPIEKASDKQIKLLKVLGYKGSTNLTMTEAHHLIKNLKEKEDE